MRPPRQRFDQVWDIKGVKEYFKRELPDEIVLDGHTTIINVRRFVDRHIGYVEANNGNPMYRKYYIRLKMLKKLLEGDWEMDKIDHTTMFQNKLI